MVTVKQPYQVYMSANSTGAMSMDYTGETMFTFKNDLTIPSYLLAMAVGNLTRVAIDTRTGVISEPDRVHEYAQILEDLPMLLKKAEEYTKIPYIWGEYNILIMPPSFPVGGMENPLLTFASPSIMVKDKSQIYVATHEIAHSWTGNMVTCKDWSNLWINEGLTVFIERVISGQLHGDDFSKIESQLGNASLWEDM